jgi:hypothetical protein
MLRLLRTAQGHAEGGVLRHVDPNADDVVLDDLEHEGAARGIALHETADIDVALSDYAVERRDHRGIIAVLAELLDQFLLSGDAMFCSGNCGFLRVQVPDVDVALLRGDPAVLDQWFVPTPGRFCEPSAGLRLVQRRLELIKSRFVLRNLIIEHRHCELRQQISCLDAIPMSTLRLAI